jgi:YD repeat-containing protein
MLRSARERGGVSALTAILFLLATAGQAQTTYHLHKDTPTSQFQLTPSIGGTTVTVTTANLKNVSGERVVQEFDTLLNVPNRGGYLPPGNVNFRVYLKKSSNSGVIAARAKLFLNSATGIQICNATNGTLSSTLQLFDFNCTILANQVLMHGSDRFHLWVGVNIATAPTQNTTVSLSFDAAANDSTVALTLPPAPSITTLNPNTAAIGGSVTITGSNLGTNVDFTGAVTFNGTPGTVVPPWTDTSVTALVPAGATTGNVIVKPYGVNSNGLPLTVVPPPNITGVSLPSGTPGTPVTITGSNFGSTSGTVIFTGALIAAPTSTWTPSSISATVPAGAISNDSIVVHASGVDSNSVPFSVPVPTITSFFPLSGRYGTSVTITGTNFGTINSPGYVKFNGTPATSASSWSDTIITAAIPTGATTGPLKIYESLNSSQNFTVIPPPSITQLSPSAGPVNTVVTVTGVGFGSPQGNSTITFNGTPAKPSSWNNETIFVPVPSGSTTGPVVITAGGQVSPGAPFTVSSPPSIISLTPNSGAAGAPVNIAGSNFGSSGVVRFNGVAASVTNWTAGSIDATAPDGVSTGPVTVTVSGQTSNGVTFTAVTAGTLSGSVTRSSDGTPVNGALVEALQNNAVKFSGSTASNGSYTISSVTGGTYDLRVSASGLGSALQNAVSIPAGQNTTNNFSLSAPGTISGQVTQSDGVTPISGASVQVYVGAAAGAGVATDGSGNYSIGTLNAGTYSVQASAAGFVSKTRNNVAVSGGVSTNANFALFTPGNGPINYAYDELGRLIAVSDSTGDTAIYSYDAVGNILSIERRNSAAVSIISFSPKSGVVGSAITISGTGFSTTPSQNTVQFNGTTATVNSSTATQMEVVVPTGATSGTIAVTSPSGSATSSGSFTVLTDAGVPTITSFTPPSGVSGNALTVTGTNFDPAPVNDNLRLNVTAQLVTSAIATSLSTTVPAGTGSGKISLTTPKGKATSSQDFYVPFGTHVANDIGYTNRIDFGQTQTVTLASNKIGLVLFEGVQGKKAFVRWSGSTFPGCSINIYDPYNRPVGGGVSCNSSSPGGAYYLDARLLPVTGTYVIGVDPGASAGSIPITLVDATDNAYNITPTSGAGTTITVSNTAAGQASRIYWNGYAGQRLSIAINSTSYTGTPSFGPAAVNVSILGLDGNAILSPTSSQSTTFIDPDNYSNQLTLPTAGTYYVLVDPNADYVGSMTLTVYDVPPDPTPTWTLGSSSSVGTSTPGQNARPGFSVSAGQHLSLSYSTGTMGNNCSLRITNPNSSASPWPITSGCNATGFLDLPYPLSAGLYTLGVNPVGTTTGTFQGTINIATDNSYNISPTPSGAAVAVSNTVPGQNDQVTFTGTAGHKLSIIGTSASYSPAGNPSLSITGPSGSLLSGASLFAGSFTDPESFTNKLQLPSSGTYTILIDPVGASVGNAGLTVYDVVDVSGALSVGGSTLPVQTVTPGQNVNLTFSGTSGTQVTVHLTGNSFTTFGVAVSLIRQDGTTVLTSSSSTAGSFNLSTVTLPATETYTVKINPANTATGNISVNVTTP